MVKGMVYYHAQTRVFVRGHHGSALCRAVHIYNIKGILFMTKRLFIS